MPSDHRKILFALLTTCGFSLCLAQTPRIELPFKGRPIPRTGVTGSERTEIRFENQRDHLVKIFWVTDTGEGIAYGELKPGTFKRQSTYPGHVWMITDPAGYPLGHFIGVKKPGVARITKE